MIPRQPSSKSLKPKIVDGEKIVDPSNPDLISSADQQSLKISQLNDSLLQRGMALRRLRRSSHLVQNLATLKFGSGSNSNVISEKIFDTAEDENLQKIIAKQENMHRMQKSKTQAKKRSYAAKNLASVKEAVIIAQDVATDGTPTHYDAEQQSLIMRAIFAQWGRHSLALGFRKWQTYIQASKDAFAEFISNIPDLKNEVKRILLVAEAARFQQTQAAAQQSSVLYPYQYVLRDRDILYSWARQYHAKSFQDVTEASIRYLLKFMRFRQYEDGDTIFLEGDVGDKFYMIHHGTVAVHVGIIRANSIRMDIKSDESQSARARSPRELAQKSTIVRTLPYLTLGKRVFAYRTGESFGETAMFTHDSMRTASAVAVGHCEICEVPKEIYCSVLRKHHQRFFERAQKINFLQRVPIFRDWQRERLSQVADVLTRRKLHFGEILFNEIKTSEGGATEVSSPRDDLTYKIKTAQNATCCYFILSGCVKLTKKLPDDLTERRTRRNAAFRTPIQVQELQATETIALELLLSWGDSLPSNGRNGLDYTAVASSATVELYALEEIDAQRVFAANGWKTLQESIREQVNHDRSHRIRRFEKASQILNAEYAAQAEDAELMRLRPLFSMSREDDQDMLDIEPDTKLVSGAREEMDKTFLTLQPNTDRIERGMMRHKYQTTSDSYSSNNQVDSPREFMLGLQENLPLTLDRQLFNKSASMRKNSVTGRTATQRTSFSPNHRRLKRSPVHTLDGANGLGDFHFSRLMERRPGQMEPEQCDLDADKSKIDWDSRLQDFVVHSVPHTPSSIPKIPSNRNRAHSSSNVSAILRRSPLHKAQIGVF